MATFLEKLKVNSAITNHSKQDLSCRHITTSNWMEFDVAKYMELVPKQKISFKWNTFTRLEPLVVPTFGDGVINRRCFFVPYRTVFPAWNDFITDSKHVFDDGTIATPSNVPYTDDAEFRQVFMGAGYSEPVLVDVADENCDFIVLNADGTVNSRRKFTNRGRHAYKILRQLGYSIDFNYGNKGGNHSLLPLLSLCKVYVDWYSCSAYSFDARYQDVARWFTYNRNDITEQITSTDLSNMLNLLWYVNYDSDYFTACWDNPNMPNQGSASAVTIKDINNGSTSTLGRQVISGQASNYGGNNAPLITGINSSGNSSNIPAVSQYVLTALKSLTDYMKRHQLVGARALDRYLARFGVNLDAEKLNRSYYLGSSKQMLEIGDVTSTSDTEGARLGAYAGKGYGFDTNNFEFSTDEYGMFFCICTFIPKIGYVAGQDRTTMHLSKLDFYTPEFDNLGCQAVGVRELAAPLNANQTQGVVDWNNQVFGFIPRYAEYKTGRDCLSGDYTLGSLNTGKDAWNLFRDVMPLSLNDTVTDLKHSIFFMEAAADARQYNRIFYNTSPDVDHLNVIHTFDISSYFPGKSMYDTYEFTDKGDKVTVNNQGVKCN